MFSSWSRTQRGTPRRAAGASLTSRTASLPARQCTKPAIPATSPPKIATLSSPITHLFTGADRVPHERAVRCDDCREAAAGDRADRAAGILHDLGLLIGV